MTSCDANQCAFFMIILYMHYSCSTLTVPLGLSVLQFNNVVTLLCQLLLSYGNGRV